VILSPLLCSEKNKCPDREGGKKYDETNVRFTFIEGGEGLLYLPKEKNFYGEKGRKRGEKRVLAAPIGKIAWGNRQIFKVRSGLEEGEALGV